MHGYMLKGCFYFYATYIVFQGNIKLHICVVHKDVCTRTIR